MSHTELKELKQADQLMREGMINEALQIVLELEKRGDLSNQDLLSCNLLIGKLFRRSAQYSEALKYADQVLQESQKQGDSISYLDGLLIQAYSFLMMGNLNQSNTILKHAEEVFENLKGVLKINLRERESFLVRIKSLIMGLTRGPHELLCLKLNERALELAKDSDDKDLIITCLLNMAEDHQALGDYDKAINYAKRAIEIRYPPLLLASYGQLIEILLSKGDVANAKFYFQHMREEKDISKKNNFLYQYYEALILKTSLRARDRIKAEEIFKQIVKEKESFEFVAKALINICDLLLIELRITNDSDLINEINSYITMLLNFAEQHQTFFNYYFAAETYLLQGKLNLLTFNIKNAKRFLTQAQQIAERYGTTKLATKITKESDDLAKNEDLWKKLKEEGATMADRVALARLHEQIEGMIRNPTITTVYIKDEEVAITEETKICLVCRGKVMKFSYICECGAIYCENCARALSNLENICWVCDAPIDSSKPIKPYKEERIGKFDKKKDKG
ncbi:MAG: tetratricopeptide repeat protein [Promethearchaeota archaeon]